MERQKIKYPHNKVNRKELKQRLIEDAHPRTTVSFYKYHTIQDVANYRNELFYKMNALGVLGRIYVAHEGINAQISIPAENMEAFKDMLYSYACYDQLRLNVAVEDDGKSFFALIIKIRTKIVADGIIDPLFDPADTGTHLTAEAFNTITDDPNTVLVDMRNHYESEVGHFEDSILPDVTTFRESLPIIADMLAENKDKQIVMYCTGGIRCEKASAYMKYRGFNNVFQLNGGVIEYARQVKDRGLKNKFKGINFVFDERLGERISEDVIAHCHQCGASCDHHVNCANDHCHLLFIQCEACGEKYTSTCSLSCKEFNMLPEDDRKTLGKTLPFNGTRFGKNGYKALKKATLTEDWKN